MAEMKFSFEEICKLMARFSELKLGELDLEDGEFALSLRAKETPVQTVVTAVPAVTAAGDQTVTDAAAELPAGNVVKSPIVGTFYAAPAPEEPPFVTVGSQVKKGDVLFVIESMKLMNEVQSDFDGEIVQILVENAQGVEYNQPVMIIN